MYLTLQALIMSWNSVAVSHTTIDNRILYGCLQYRHITENTLEEWYRVLVWSLGALADGRFPEADHNGKKFDATYYPSRTFDFSYMATGLQAIHH